MKLRTMHIASAIAGFIAAIFVTVFVDSRAGVLIVSVLSGFLIGGVVERYAFRK